MPDAADGNRDDQALIDKIEHSAATSDAQVETNLDLAGALQTIWEAMTATNQYFADQAPWSLRKADPARADAVLYVTAEALRRLAIMAYWAIPDACGKMLAMLGREPPIDRNERFNLLVAGDLLPTPAGVFPRLERPA